MYFLEENLLELLIEGAKMNSNRKARLCLHPTSDEMDGCYLPWFPCLLQAWLDSTLVSG
jgi:hypothetical protein